MYQIFGAFVSLIGKKKWKKCHERDLNAEPETEVTSVSGLKYMRHLELGYEKKYVICSKFFYPFDV